MAVTHMEIHPLIYHAIDNVFDTKDFPLTFEMSEINTDFYARLKWYSPEMDDEINALARDIDQARQKGIETIIFD